MCRSWSCQTTGCWPLCLSLHLISDPIVFTLSGHNDSLLRCEVNVTQDAGFALSVTHEGRTLQTDSAEGVVEAQPYVTLSETVSVRKGGEYECQLHLMKDLITKSIFHVNQPGNPPPPDRKKLSSMRITCRNLNLKYLFFHVLSTLFFYLFIHFHKCKPNCHQFKQV